MILAKGNDNITFEITSFSTLPFIEFGYEVYENYDTETNTWDSHTFNYGICQYNALSWNFVNDIEGIKTIYTSLNMGNQTFSFSDGEYFTLDGNPFDLATINSNILIALNS